jgi:hypothetical protein
VKTIATAFTDHFSVVLRLPIDAPLPLRGRGYCKMNVYLVQDVTFMSVVETQWERWQQHKRIYPNTVMWWGRYAKRMMLQIFIQEGTSRRRDRQILENFYYEAIYTALQEDNLRGTTFLTLKQLKAKAKIVRLYHEPHHHLFLDNDDQNKIEDEEPSLHHLVKRQKRQDSRMANSVYDNDGNIQTTPMNILRTFTLFMKKEI